MTKAEGALLIIVVFVAVMRWAFNKVRRERDEIARLR
jgi:cbb3-type cytochrome oxidase subunit 3